MSIGRGTPRWTDTRSVKIGRAFLAFMPQLVDPDRGSVTVQVIYVGLGVTAALAGGRTARTSS